MSGFGVVIGNFDSPSSLGDLQSIVLVDSSSIGMDVVSNSSVSVLDGIECNDIQNILCETSFPAYGNVGSQLDILIFYLVLSYVLCRSQTEICESDSYTCNTENRYKKDSDTAMFLSIVFSSLVDNITPYRINPIGNTISLVI